MNELNKEYLLEETKKEIISFLHKLKSLMDESQIYVYQRFSNLCLSRMIGYNEVDVKPIDLKIPISYECIDMFTIKEIIKEVENVTLYTYENQAVDFITWNDEKYMLENQSLFPVKYFKNEEE